MAFTQVASLSGFEWVTDGGAPGPIGLLFEENIYINAPADSTAALMVLVGDTFEIACSLSEAGSLRYVALYDDEIYGITSDGKLLSWDGTGDEWTLRDTLGSYTQSYGLLVIDGILYAVFDNAGGNIRVHSWNGSIAATFSNFTLGGGDIVSRFFGFGCFTLNDILYCCDAFGQIFSIDPGGRTQITFDFIELFTYGDDPRIPIVVDGVVYIPTKGILLADAPSVLSWDGSALSVSQHLFSNIIANRSNDIAYRSTEGDFAVLTHSESYPSITHTTDSWDGSSVSGTSLGELEDAPYSIFYLDETLYVFVARNTTHNYLFREGSEELMSRFVVSNMRGTVPFYFRLTDVSDVSSYTSATDYQRVWSIINNRTSVMEYFETTSASVEYCISAGSNLDDTYTISLSAVI